MSTPAATEERLRFTQCVAAVLVIGGFVFEFAWIAPVLAALVVVAVVFGPSADLLAWPFDRWLASRVRTTTPVSSPTVRAVLLTTAIGLGVATLVGGTGFPGLGELLALIAGVIAVLYATTGIVAIQAFTNARAEREERTHRRRRRSPRDPGPGDPGPGSPQR